ncbi:hypothetical protein QTG54_012762 [Skeletonema marinoi]|uniref:Uncharacterized protein n=1 Tax=Skeletonema marinoi TaxID=267567 RepID=A0AAD9D8H8_9STRA|nr:hypothetical protein QTG54_012762 [Skeletonema marinoi]
MKFIASVVAAVAVQSASAFVGPQCQRTIVSSSTQQSMGLFDFFSEDARKEREARKQAEVEEQEQMQREIIARRSNPKKMEEYEAKVRVRRALRMSGDDDAADSIDIYSGEDEKIVGLN